MQIQSILAGGPPQTQPTNVSAQQNAATTSTVGSGYSAINTGTIQSNAVSATGQTEKQPQASREDVNKARQKIEETVQAFSQKLEFSVDDETEAFVVKVVDKETKEVIRQIPSEELLNIAKALDSLQGLLIKDQA
ncbi:flagellar protein FlaG [Propionivibrio limicola]|uniref:flagellar protein FlaG n=1 Tax=Propionivibrio limicola TaxID=167645 RepID=UPI00147914CF|nr:flagellar protein FlaG [Propionivibrio limicola]